MAVLKKRWSIANKWNTVYLVGLFPSYTAVHGNNVLQNSCFTSEPKKYAFTSQEFRENAFMATRDSTDVEHSPQPFGTMGGITLHCLANVFDILER